MRIFLIFLIFSLDCLNLKATEQSLPSYKELSSLTNPKKLATLKKGNRSANQRLLKLLYWMHQYEKIRVTPKDFLTKLYDQHGDIAPYSNEDHVYAPLTEKKNLEAQYRLGRLYGLYTPPNLELLRSGKSPIITLGQHLGQKIEVDHLIAFAIAPELENSMANLSLLPMSLNREKGATFTNAAKNRAEALKVEVGWEKKEG